MSIKCIACGMPMIEKDDYALGDVSKNYCKYCMTPNGTMQSYEEKLESFTNFIMKTKNIPQNEAKQLAKLQMSNLPAWNNIN